MRLMFLEIRSLKLENQIPHLEFPESQILEIKFIETQLHENQSPHLKFPETTRFPETHIPENQVPHSKFPETQIPEARAKCPQPFGCVVCILLRLFSLLAWVGNS